jgi:hypothetical protein
MDEKSIEDWCIEFKLKYYIIIDNIVNVDDGVYLHNMNLEKIPVQFGIITTYFECSNNKLRSLKGSPMEVPGHFLCNNNQLNTLEGSSWKVGKAFQCHYNNLTSLIGSPREVGGGFICSDNKLTTLEGAPIKIGGAFYCIDNPVWEEYRKYNNYAQYMRSVKLRELCK